MDRLAVRGRNPDIARKNLDMVIENSEPSDVFEVDVSSIARTLGCKIATLIAKGIVQDHYKGDWSRVRFIGLGEELPLSPRLQLSEELGAV